MASINKENSKSTSNGSLKENGKKYKFYRKPVFTKRAPEVRQTKTSMKRLLQANPLLKLDKGEKEGMLCSKTNLSASSLKIDNYKQPDDNAPKSSFQQLKSNRKVLAEWSKPSLKIHSQHLDKSLPFVKPNRPPIKNKSVKNKSNVTKQKVEKLPNKACKQLNGKQSTQLKHSMNISVQTESLRRSNSAEHFTESKIGLGDGDNSNLHKSDQDISSSFTHRRSVYNSHKPLPSLSILQKRLNEWLTKRGKNVRLFHNLKISSPVINEDDKENVEVIQDFKNRSYEDLQIPHTKESNSKITVQVAKEALEDLLGLIQEGYPLPHCEAWLELIKNAHKDLPSEPEYWECRASIEQGRANICTAVEFYKTAIIHGAEISEVDKLLDTLLQKFSLLNINTESISNEKPSRERARIIQDARNAFKSSIIGFAIQEKKLKDENKIKLIATPVRRSCRLSRSLYTSTPGIKVYSSLKELDTPERQNVEFKINKAFE